MNQDALLFQNKTIAGRNKRGGIEKRRSAANQSKIFDTVLAACEPLDYINCLSAIDSIKTIPLAENKTEVLASLISAKRQTGNWERYKSAYCHCCRVAALCHYLYRWQKK